MPCSFQRLDDDKRSCPHVDINEQNYKNVDFHRINGILFLHEEGAAVKIV